MGGMEDVSSFSMPSASALAPVSSFSFSQASQPAAPAAPAVNPNTASIIQQAIARNKKLMAEKAEAAEQSQVQQAAIISTPAPRPAPVAVAQTV